MEKSAQVNRGIGILFGYGFIFLSVRILPYLLSVPSKLMMFPMEFADEGSYLTDNEIEKFVFLCTLFSYI